MKDMGETNSQMVIRSNGIERNHNEAHETNMEIV